jgi:hypothetical protein
VIETTCVARNRSRRTPRRDVAPNGDLAASGAGTSRFALVVLVSREISVVSASFSIELKRCNWQYFVSTNDGVLCFHLRSNRVGYLDTFAILQPRAVVDGDDGLSIGLSASHHPVLDPGLSTQKKHAFAYS